MKISSLDREVKQVLEAGYYKIPRFQRPFSWNKENVEDFWKDALDNIESEYFIGSMVVFRESEGHYGVVDGQQRLTTITMILAAIRNQFKALGREDLASGVHQLIEKKNIDNIDEYVLQTETSYPYFHEHIQKNSPTSEAARGSEEETAIKIAFQLITELTENRIRELTQEITKNVKEISLDELIKIRNKLLKLKLIFIDLDNEDDAYVIFETLNSRGKDLQTSDLIKNILLKMAQRHNKGVDLGKDKWKILVDTLNGSKADLSLSDFFLHYWLSKYEYLTEKQLFKKFKPLVTGANAIELLNTFIQEATWYRAIDDSDYIDWDKQELNFKASLDAIGLFKVRQPKPALLSIMSTFKSKKIKLRDAENITKVIENFHYLSTAITSQRSSGGMSKLYASLGRSLRNCNGDAEKKKLISDFTDKFRKASPTKDEFLVGFSNLVYSNAASKQKKVVQYTLEKIDQFLRDETPINYSQMTIEHLMPQSKSKENIDDEVIGSIGNLLFVPSELNKVLSNKPFDKKLKILTDNAYPMDDILKNANTWGVDEINNRTKLLGDLAFSKIWKI